MNKRDIINQQLRRFSVIDWAEEHNLVINPSKGMETAIESFAKFGYCPCDPSKSRTNCPCQESLSDIKEVGHCICRLFWKDLNTFRATLKGVTSEKGTASPDSGTN